MRRALRLARRALAGLFGFASERVRDNPPGKRATIFGLPAGRTLAAITSAGLLGTAGEAGLLHFRGAYHTPFMFVPVTVPPFGAALLGRVVAEQGGRREQLVRRVEADPSHVRPRWPAGPPPV